MENHSQHSGDSKKSVAQIVQGLIDANLVPPGHEVPPKALERAMAGLSPTSARCWLSQLRSWRDWACSHPEASTRELIQAFANECRAGDRSANTGIGRFWALGRLYDVAGLQESPERLLLRQVSKTLTQPPRSPTPNPRGLRLSRNQVSRILACAQCDHVADLRDAALVALLFDTRASPNDVLGYKVDAQWITPPVQVEHVRRLADGSGQIALPMGRSQGQAGIVLTLSAPTLRWLDAWIAAAGLTSGALFRSLPTGECSFGEGPPLQPGTALKHFRRLATRAGLAGHELTFHCLRGGDAVASERASERDGLALPDQPEDPCSCEVEDGCSGTPTHRQSANGAWPTPAPFSPRNIVGTGVTRLDRLRHKLVVLVQQAAGTLLPPEQEWDADAIAAAVMTSLHPLSIQTWMQGLKAWLRRTHTTDVSALSRCEVIRDFADWCGRARLKSSTAAGYFWALGHLLEIAGFRQTPERELLGQIATQFGRMVPPPKPVHRALMRAHVERMLECVRPDCVRDVRDAALVVILHETLARTTEVLGRKLHGEWLMSPVQVDQVRRMRDGTGRIVLASEFGKDISAQEYVLSAWAMQRVDAWLHASGVTSGALFRSLLTGQTCFLEGPPLQEVPAQRCFKRLVARAGFGSDGFTLGSLRTGGANELLRSGMHPEVVRRVGRWSTIGRVGYHQIASMTRSPTEELAAHYARTKATTTHRARRSPDTATQLLLPW